MSKELLATPLPDQLESAMHEVFSTMIPIPIESLERKPVISAASNCEVLAVLGYNGTKVGSFLVTTSNGLAKKIAATLLMADSPDEVSDEETSDALGEVLNMIGGNFKNFLVENGQAMELATPTVVAGSTMHANLPTKSVAGFTLDFALEGEPLSLTFYYLM
jgi:CheY-specific phosphatase CheX